MIAKRMTARTTSRGRFTKLVRNDSLGYCDKILIDNNNHAVRIHVADGDGDTVSTSIRYFPARRDAINYVAGYLGVN